MLWQSTGPSDFLMAAASSLNRLTEPSRLPSALDLRRAMGLGGLVSSWHLANSSLSITPANEKATRAHWPKARCRSMRVGVCCQASDEGRKHSDMYSATEVGRLRSFRNMRHVTEMSFVSP